MWNNSLTKSLIKAVLSLKNEKEALSFFRDLLTEQEIAEFGKRWQTALLLYKKTPYSNIEKITGLSSTTIARISRWLNNGMGGYRLVMKRTDHRTHALSPSGKRLR